MIDRSAYQRHPRTAAKAVTITAVTLALAACASPTTALWRSGESTPHDHDPRCAVRAALAEQGRWTEPAGSVGLPAASRAARPRSRERSGRLNAALSHCLAAGSSEQEGAR
jgi:putative hemolysin